MPVPWMIALLLRAAAVGEPASAAEGRADKLVISLAPEINIFRQKARFGALGDHLRSRIGVPVEFVVRASYADAVADVATGRVDGVFLGSFACAVAIEQVGAIPIARVVEPDGSSTYRGVMFVRRDSGLRTVADLRGKRMAFVDRTTSAGYLFPLAWLRSQGVRQLDGFFSEQYFTGSHDAAVRAVLGGAADVGVSKNTVLERMSRDDPRVRQELVVVATSTDVPSVALLVRKGLDPGRREAIRAALLAAADDPAGAAALAQIEAVRFVPTDRSDYRAVIDMARGAGVDVATFRLK